MGLGRLTAAAALAGLAACASPEDKGGAQEETFGACALDALEQVPGTAGKDPMMSSIAFDAASATKNGFTVAETGADKISVTHPAGEEAVAREVAAAAASCADAKPRTWQADAILSVAKGP